MTVFSTKLTLFSNTVVTLRNCNLKFGNDYNDKNFSFSHLTCLPPSSDSLLLALVVEHDSVQGPPGKSIRKDSRYSRPSL